MVDKTNVEIMLQRFKDNRIISSCKRFMELMELQLFDNEYRGLHMAQHDRKNKVQTLIMLKAFYKHSSSNGFEMKIAPKDNREKFYELLNEEEISSFQNYINFVDEINSNAEYFKQGRGNNSNKDQFATLKKQFLKNLFDVGGIFTCRVITKSGISKDKQPGERAGGGNTVYKLTEKVISYIRNNDDKGLELYILDLETNHYVGKASTTIKFLTDDLIKSKNIKVIESKLYTLTLSYYGKQNKYGFLTNFNIIKEAYIELSSNKAAVKAIVTIYNEMYKLTKKGGSLYYGKKGIIDWRNFRNQTDSLFDLISQTPGFNLDKNKNIYSEWMKKDEEFKKPNRSKREKELYWEKHNLKREDYEHHELHHIVPLEQAKSYEEWKIIDSWINMILISPNGHANFPNRNNHWTVIGDMNEHELKINSIIAHQKEFIFNNSNDVAYDPHWIANMTDLNRKLNN